MIFVALGTQDKSFKRLLEIAEKINTNDKIVCQAGFTKYESSKLDIHDYFDADEYNRIINEADVVITTGTHTAVPMCNIAHKAGKKVVYIETFANVNTPTKAGKMIYKIADKFIVQWPEMKNVYDKAECWGSIF